MKKVVSWFNKKKKAVISDGIDADAIPEPPRNIPRYVPKKSSLYNDFKYDKCCTSKNKTVNNACNSSSTGSEIREEPLHINGPVTTVTDLNSQLVPQDDVKVVRQPSSSHSLEEISRLPIITTTGPSNESDAVGMSDTLSVNSSENLSRVNSSNSMAVQEADPTHDLPGDWVPKKLLGDKKNGGNTYVITITNSTHFHIGTQKTINYPGAEDNNVQKSSIPFTNISNGKLLALDGNQILDIKDRLSEDDLLQISLSVRDKWQEFARNLGVDESTIHELEELNDSDYNLIVYDVLQQYLSRYPDTTVGFMVNVLRKSNEIEAIRKLTEKR